LPSAGNALLFAGVRMLLVDDHSATIYIP
jgi:hypothetical protein